MGPGRLVLAGLLLGGLAGAGPAARARRVPIGGWGGARVGLAVEETKTRLEFDCAHGTIGRPLTLDGKGGFLVEGRYFPEHGGPVRADEDSEGRPARYSGSLSDRIL